jgi:hypothetical protein
MCCQQRMFGSICLNIGIMFCFTVRNYADHFTLQVVTLGSWRTLLKRYFGGKKANSDKFISLENKFLNALFIQMLSPTVTGYSFVNKANTSTTLRDRKNDVIT